MEKIMSLVKYEIFVESIKLGSLSRAAEKMGYTQSGVSHIMKSLEAEVGFPLFTRTAFGIQPNSEGRLLLPYPLQCDGNMYQSKNIVFFDAFFYDLI